MSQPGLILALKLPKKPNPKLPQMEIQEELIELTEEARNKVILWLRSVDSSVEFDTPEGLARSSPILIVTKCGNDLRDRLKANKNRPQEIEAVDSYYSFAVQGDRNGSDVAR